MRFRKDRNDSEKFTRTKTLAKMLNLYFIAVVLPENISETVTDIKKHFAEKYCSKAALKSPPHITLHMPFKWEESQENQIIHKIKVFSKGRSAFKIRLNGYNAFPPRVIFIDVKESLELDSLQSDLYKDFKNLFGPVSGRDQQKKVQKFHPHVTVAFRDLNKSAFSIAWEEFRMKPFEASFEISAIQLLKHDGHQWKTYKSFIF